MVNIAGYVIIVSIWCIFLVQAQWKYEVIVGNFSINDKPSVDQYVYADYKFFSIAHRVVSKHFIYVFYNLEFFFKLKEFDKSK